MIGLIAAFSENRVIGKNGHIPWKIKEDLAHFKELTSGNVLIMGRKTFEEIGKPLENRFSIIISTTKNFNSRNWSNCVSVKSFEEAVALAEKITIGTVDLPGCENFLNPFFNRDIFICGGASVFEKGLKIAEKLFITQIHSVFEGDTFFPLFDETGYDKKILKKSDEKNCDFSYDFLVFTKQ